MAMSHLLVLLLVAGASGLRLPTLPRVTEHAKAAGAAAALSALLVAAPVSAGVSEAAKDLTDAAYPIIGSLQKDKVAPLASKAVGVALTASPREIIKTVDAGLDAFLSVPPEKFYANVKALKSAVHEAAEGKAACNLVCLPPLESAEKVGSTAADALATIDQSKVKAFALQGLKTLNSADKLALAPLLLDGTKFAASLNPADVAKATAAALELAKASGAAE